MNGKFLLDTNILIAIFAADPSVQENLAQPAEIFVPIVAIGELYYGARKSTRIEANIRIIDELAPLARFLSATSIRRAIMGGSRMNFAEKGDQFPRTIFGSRLWRNSTS